MGRKSTISRLPADVKSYIEGKLAEGRYTLDELIADLRDHFPGEAQQGVLPSRSALHRYGPKLERRLIAVKAFTDAAMAIDAHASDKNDSRSSALTAIVQQEMFDAIINLQDASDPDADPSERVSMLSTAAKNIATLTRSSFSLKTFQAKVVERTQAAAASVEKIAKKGGLSAESAAELRREILGIAA
jgi:hypothetical protein